MAKVISTVGEHLKEPQLDPALSAAAKLLAEIVEEDAYVGEVYSLGYEEALVQIHDFHRQKIGGIPALSFLIATRLVPSKAIDVREEDSSVLLRRVLDQSNLPNDAEALRVRVENAQRVSGELEKTWDHRDVMDPTTHHLLSYAGVKCRVLGTFYVANLGTDAAPQYRLSFGSDLSNYYPNRGLKVFKPRGHFLERIVNYRDPRTNLDEAGPLVNIGEVRYASTNRSFQQIASVPVAITPTDLLGQKTALFGMTRTGKSNTTKIMLKSIFGLRWQPTPRRIGQIVFDPNGEYANENAQDMDDSANPNAIKNVWACGPADKQSSLKEDVVTYGITKHPHDPNRRLMLLNFHVDDNLQIGKQIIDSALAGDKTKYISNFRDVMFEAPDPSDHSATVRHKRRVLCYRALLYKAGLQPPPSIQPQTTQLFSKPFLDAMEASAGKSPANYQHGAKLLRKATLNWAQMVEACKALQEYINDDTSAYRTFDNQYVQTSSSGSRADDGLKTDLEM